MKYSKQANGTTVICYTAQEAQKYEHYRKCCEEALKYFSCPDDLEHVYNVLMAMAEAANGNGV